MQVLLSMNSIFSEISESDSFQAVLHPLYAGYPVRRRSWPAGHFIFAQVPAEIPVEVISRMTSLSPAVKAVLEWREKPLRYSNQIAYVDDQNRIIGWNPSPADCFATDWEEYSE